MRSHFRQLRRLLAHVNWITRKKSTTTTIHWWKCNKNNSYNRDETLLINLSHTRWISRFSVKTFHTLQRRMNKTTIDTKESPQVGERARNKIWKISSTYIKEWYSHTHTTFNDTIIYTTITLLKLSGVHDFCILLFSSI